MKMSNTRTLVAAMALTLVALPVAADPMQRSTSDGFVHVGGDAGWEPAQHRYFDLESSRHAPRASNTAASVPAPYGAVPGDFVFVGGDTGWQPAPQPLAWRSGRVVRSKPMQVQAPAATKVTASDTEEAARLYPGG
jgi:hypothetical protein